jgi:hypothetical protein
LRSLWMSAKKIGKNKNKNSQEGSISNGKGKFAC